MAHYLVCISGISDAIESVRGRLEESSECSIRNSHLKGYIPLEPARHVGNMRDPAGSSLFFLIEEAVCAPESEYAAWIFA